MLNKCTGLDYPILAIVSIGRKNFENMGRYLHKSGDTVSRLLESSENNFLQAQKISKLLFLKKKKLFVIIDDSLVKKFFAELMQGTGRFFDTKNHCNITAFRIISCLISDGRYSIPIGSSYLFSKELTDLMQERVESKEDIAKKFVTIALKLFPKASFTVLVDGLYCTESFLKWCIESKIALEARMHSNRVVIYNGEKTTLKNLLNKKGILPKGRKKSKTISVLWRNLPLEVSVVRRIDKKEDESIVFQAATYKALSHKHVANYKKRWPIEKMFRTTKQRLGLEDCQSIRLSIQDKHTSAVMLAYAIVQLEMQTYRLKTPEEAIRQLEKKNAMKLIERFACQINTFFDVHA
jgi:Transposase DDE domain